ncbi:MULTISPECIES: phage tail tape measure protein [unclassified Serratia (in: enterobacteria)]|uniref:phage tail tape measure protein n=1 Tax=unclassified Serratia (in: enterobacteria) TaxID=2647522 RepID=UPI0030760250
MTDRKLQIQVALGAVNNLTRPLQAAQKSSAALAGQIKATRDNLKQLSSQASSFDRLTESSRKTADQVAAAQMKTRQMASALRMLENPTQKQIAAVQKQNAELTKLQNRQKDEVQQLNKLKVGFYQQGISISSSSTATAQITSHTEKLNRQLQEQEQRLKRVGAARERYDKGQELRGNLRSAGTTALMTGAAMAAPLALTVRSYSSLEDAMKGVAKQVDGLLDDQGNRTARYTELQRLIQTAAESTPLPGGSIDYAALIEGGGRMGVVNANDSWENQRRDLLTFANTAAKASKAFELPAGELAEDLGKIAGLYKIPIKDIEALGDAINYLDDNAKSKGADIIDVLKRIGGNADRMGYKQAAALGSTFLSLGAEREIAASASNAMVRELSIATMQSDKFFEALNALGVNAGRLEKSMALDAMGTIRSVLEAASKLPATDRLRVLTQLFGKEFGDDAAKLANNLAELDRQLTLVGGNAAKGSMTREANIDKNSLSSQWELLKAGATGASQSIGEQLRPALMSLIETGKRWVGSVRRWVEQHPVLAGTLVKLAALAAVLTLGMGALLISVAALLGPFLALRLGVGLLAGNSARAALSTGLLSRALGGLRAVAIKAFNAPLNGTNALGQRLSWFTRSPLKSFGGGFSATLQRIGLLLSRLALPITLVGVAFVATAFTVRKYWEPLKAWFSGFFAGITDGVEKTREQGSVLGWAFSNTNLELSRSLLGLKRAWDWVSDVFSAASRRVEEFLAPVRLTREELDKVSSSGFGVGKALSQAFADAFPHLKLLSDELTLMMETLKLIPNKAERIRLENVRNNTMNNAMPDPGHTGKDAVINIWDEKKKAFTAWPRLPFVGPLDGRPADSVVAPPRAVVKPVASIWGSNPPKAAQGSATTTATPEKKDPNKLGDIVFKNVAPHIALASPYLTAQREQARAINGLTKAADALRKSTTGLDKFGSIGLGQGAGGFAGIFAEPQKQQTSVFNQLRAIASGVLQRAQDWIGGGPQLAFAGAGAVLAPQANQRTVLARLAPTTIEGNTYHLSFDLKEAGQLDERKIAMLVKEQITDIERQRAMKNRSQLRDRE